MNLLTLENIKAFLTQFAEQSESVYWLGDPDFTYLAYISPAYEKIWGRPRQAVYDDPRIWITHLHPEDQTHHPILEMKANILKQGAKARFRENYRVVRPNGEIRWMIDRGFPVCDETGKIIAITGVAVDVTQEKLREAELDKAKNAAETASQAKSAFIANMSHDIRTPITGMLGLIDALKESQRTDSDRQDVLSLRVATEELLKILNEVLSVIELESGQVKQPKEVFSIQNMIQHNVQFMQAAARHKKIILQYFIDDTIPDFLIGNRFNLDRVILNLLSNAIKFTDHGEVTLRVRAECPVDSAVQLTITVKDTGIGIPQEKQKEIFEPFSRLTPSFHGIYKGSGFGLYLVKQYLTEMGAAIRVESQLQTGSCFIVTLPLSIAAPDQIPLPTKTPLIDLENTNTLTASSTVDLAKAPLAATKLLIVEDNNLAARMVQILFKKLGCVCDFAKSGHEAIAALKEQTYDLILMDIGLADQSGLEVAREVRSLLKNQKTPIVALTGHLSADKKQACLNAGMQDMITKPITLACATELLQRFVS